MYIEKIVLISIYLLIVTINTIIVVKYKKQSEKIHTLEDYNKTLIKVNDSICGFKHDFSNFVQALDGYAQTENIAGVKTMSRSILKDCVYTKNLESLNPNLIKNAAIYSIISKKFFLAQSKNVNMNVEIMTDLKDIEKLTYEVCRILAILLDNAIEAAKECESGYINLRILKDNRVSRKIIIVENTYKNEITDLDKLFEKGFTSKDYNTQSHGLGLWNVKKILRKNDNLNLYTTKGELFSQQLEIY
ncbi:MAG: GHKL domain-containing protein [Clostridia bacterium]|nr:GHKL domain-containing protein [Clostridia bacterium]